MTSHLTVALCLQSCDQNLGVAQREGAYVQLSVSHCLVIDIGALCK